MNGVRLNAFVGRSFSDEDKQVWHDLRDALDTFKPMGLAYEDAKEAQPRPISEKVRALINRNDIYIGLLTRRYPIFEPPTSFLARHGLFTAFTPNRWTTSEWVVEEIGYAIANDRSVILLIENGVVFPTADLDADTEYLRFDRANIAACQGSLTTMITILISKVSPPVPPREAAAASEISVPESKIEQATPKAGFGEQLNALREAARSGDTSAIERIQAEMLEAEKDKPTEDIQMIEAWLLGQRARYGDSTALIALKAGVAAASVNVDMLIQLYDTYMSFKQYTEAYELAMASAHRVKVEDETTLVLLAVRALRKDGKPSEALAMVIRRLGVEQVEKQRDRLLRAAAYAAQELGDVDVEAGLLEKLLQQEPADHEVRNRLAFLYDDADRHWLAVYHYNILCDKTDWLNVPNNLAVSYGALGLKASQVEFFEKVAEKFSLAKANLANLYTEAGFLNQGAGMAQQSLLSTNGDEQAKARARHALARADELRRSESEEIAKMASGIREERYFMIDYGVAYCSLDRPVQGRFETTHGLLDIKTLDGVLTGMGEETRSLPRGLGILASAISSSGLPGTFTRTYKLSLTGKMHGAAGTYELKIDTYYSGSKTADATQNIKGLFVVSADQTVIRFLERHEKVPKITEAKQILPGP